MSKVKTSISQTIEDLKTLFDLPEPVTVCVTRGTKFGNPIRVGGYFKIGKGGNGTFRFLEHLIPAEADETFTHVKDNATAVAMYREMIEKYPQTLSNIESLRGKNLACFCKLDEVCHADILLEIANK